MTPPPQTTLDAGADPRTRYRPLIRIAHLIHRQLNTQPATPFGELRSRLAYLADELGAINRICRNLNFCEQRGWLVAGRRVQQDAMHFVEEVRTRLTYIEKHANPRKLETALTPALADIIRELQQLRDEFDDWSFDETTQKLTVVTDPITLEDIDLGVFHIVLDIGKLSSSNNRAYTVEAQVPNRPAGNESVSHPHVSDDALCAGEAAVPIRRALADGRFCDFFLLVKGVLEHYNPGSAYVRLEDWHGTPCYDCGDRTDAEELCSCHHCDHEFCAQCSSSCEVCSASRCNDCLSMCARCDRSVCESCRGYCKACRKSCCHDCLNTNGICTECANPDVDDFDEPETLDVDEVEPESTAPIQTEDRHEVQPLQTSTPTPQPF